MNTKMTRVSCFQNNFCLVLRVNVASALEGLYSIGPCTCSSLSQWSHTYELSIAACRAVEGEWVLRQCSGKGEHVSEWAD